MLTENSIQLSDGRLLCYAEYGSPHGHPVMFFHGTPSSRMEAGIMGDEVFCQYGLRIIALDRPGMGGSSFQPRRSYTDWPKDVVALADHLGIEMFSVMGNSGGCPYAAVCAAKIPERLLSAVVACGAWRMDWPEAFQNLPLVNRLFWTMAKRVPFLFGPVISMMSSSSKEPSEQDLEKMKRRISPADFEALMRPEIRDRFRQMSKESMRQGTRGVAWDARLIVTEWDFQLSEIRMPFHIFHGDQDTSVPIAVARKAASLLSDARLVVFEGEGHASTPLNQFEHIARALSGS